MVDFIAVSALADPNSLASEFDRATLPWRVVLDSNPEVGALEKTR